MKNIKAYIISIVFQSSVSLSTMADDGSLLEVDISSLYGIDEINDFLEKRCEQEGVSHIAKTVLAESLLLVVDNKFEFKGPDVLGFGAGYSMCQVDAAGMNRCSPGHGTVGWGAPFRGVWLGINMEKELSPLEKELFGKTYGIFNRKENRIVSRSDKPTSRYHLYVKNISRPSELSVPGKNNRYDRISILGREIRIYDSELEEDIAIRREFVHELNHPDVTMSHGYCPKYNPDLNAKQGTSVDFFVRQVLIDPKAGEQSF